MIDDLLSQIQKIETSTSLKRISLSENERLIFNKACDFLSRREYSITELSTKLRNKFPNQKNLIRDIVLKCEEHGYLSEDRYKEMIIKKLLKRGSSKIVISKQLSLHNITVSDEEIDNCRDFLGLNQQDSIKALIEKKLRLTQNKEPKKQRESIIRFLLTKGYSYQEIKPLIELYFNDHF